MITGSNTNIRHGGKLFHVQTEDSGRRNPHVISHLYYGGTILASQKTRYSELLDLESDTLAKDVKVLIEEQHKLMLDRLKNGVYDEVIAERLGGSSDSGHDTGSGTEPVATKKDGGAEVDEPVADAAPAALAGSSRAFGDGIVSQKPLDEVILQYLVEKARDRVPDPDVPAADPSRKKE